MSTKGNTMNYVSWGLSGLVILFLLMDAGMKIAVAKPSIEAMQQLGFDLGTLRPLGVVLLICTILYAVPQTSFMGALLLTAWLGGTVAIHLRHNNPWASHILFGVYIGVALWTGLCLRTPALRALILPP